MRIRRAFTVVELIVVIGIITVLVAILIPVLSSTREQAHRTTCLANIHQLTEAWIAYALNNEGSLVSANTAGPPCWVESGNTDASITQGVLFPYVRKIEVYQCPSNYNLVNNRSYSISCVLNGACTNTVTYYHLPQIPHPVDTLAFIEEFDSRGYNWGSFALVNSSSGGGWIDRPAMFHGDGCTHSFADGHALYWKYQYPGQLLPADLAYLQSKAGY